MPTRFAFLKAALFALPFALSACATPNDAKMEETEATASTKSTLSTKSPRMRWDHRPEATKWTTSALTALRTHGAVLPSMVPADIETWCPGYVTASQEDREAFWVGLISALAKHESTWNPSAVGGGGLWFGLVQIAPPTARGYGCKANSGSALKNGADNVSCAIRIMAHTVPRDGVVSQGMRGVAADWGPFHSAAKRADMIAWTRAQPFCEAKPQTIRAQMLDRLKKDG
ncbi:transglycosylase SLT domain-containing protein [Tropicimonas sediminicola]|uniref:Transglycosylase SLT domain-containing protein n=1 Tax=Tropicimonas sediminicola TaxID=1031541 RepID=A0A239GUY6_9RHOB|nr:Transglycosylase SLT domain-containing protein [Tropicimonas sediminicola]